MEDNEEIIKDKLWFDIYSIFKLEFLGPSWNPASDSEYLIK